jgi:hypothetical protein
MIVDLSMVPTLSLSRRINHKTYSTLNANPAEQSVEPTHEYNKSSKWLITHHGNSILRLGELQAISDESRLQELVKYAATCRTVDSFRKHLSP